MTTNKSGGDPGDLAILATDDKGMLIFLPILHYDYKRERRSIDQLLVTMVGAYDCLPNNGKFMHRAFYGHSFKFFIFNGPFHQQSNKEDSIIPTTLHWMCAPFGWKTEA